MQLLKTDGVGTKVKDERTRGCWLMKNSHICTSRSGQYETSAKKQTNKRKTNNKQTDRPTGRLTDRQTGRQAGRQTDRQTDRQTKPTDKPNKGT